MQDQTIIAIEEVVEVDKVEELEPKEEASEEEDDMGTLSIQVMEGLATGVTLKIQVQLGSGMWSYY